MDWVQIGIAAFVVLAVCFAFYSKKAGRRKPYQPYESSTMENQKARKPPRPWAEDPIAKSIEWDESAKGGGGVGHKLRHVGSNRIEFQPVHPRSWYVITLLMAVGTATLVYFEGGSTGQVIMALLVFTGFSALGSLLFHFALTPVAFDRSIGIFWKGRKCLGQIPGSSSSKCAGRIDDIYALQLIKTYVTTGGFEDKPEKTYARYQINLVMKNGTRINVVNYSDSSDSLIKNAKALSMFLGKPLWDAR